MTCEEIRYVDLTLKLPCEIVEYGKALSQFCKVEEEKFWQELIVNTLKSEIVEMEGPHVNAEEIIARFDLQKVFDHFKTEEK